MKTQKRQKGQILIAERVLKKSRTIDVSKHTVCRYSMFQNLLMILNINDSEYNLYSGSDCILKNVKQLTTNRRKSCQCFLKNKSHKKKQKYVTRKKKNSNTKIEFSKSKGFQPFYRKVYVCCLQILLFDKTSTSRNSYGYA